MCCLILAQSLCISGRGVAADFSENDSIQIQSIQADFTQEKHLKILARPIISTGTFIFQAPGSLRWEYRTPVASVLLMHEGTIKKFIRQNGKLVEDHGMGLDAMQVVLTEIGNWLDGRFTDNAMFSVSFPDKRTVMLTPKDQAIAGLISNIILKLAEQKGLLDSVTIFEGPDSFTAMTFTHRALNKKIPATSFTSP
jgi:outer membrane lipoprotein-sorting protein